MTTEFIASLVDSLAWPSAVVIIVVLLREQLRDLLGPRLSRLKAGPVEAEWNRAVEEAKRFTLPPGIVGGESGARVVDDLFELAETAPSAAILEGYKRVEEALARRIGGVYEGDLPDTDASGLARLARDLDIITDQTVRAIEGLAVLRSLAVHGPPDKPTREEAGEYLGLVQAVLFTVSTWLKPDPPD